MSRASATALGPDLPFSLQEIKSKRFFESLRDLIPSASNPAYEQYCHAVGISPQEQDPMTLLAYLGKGPSNFVFEPAPHDQLPSGERVVQFREALGLSQKQFSHLLDIPVPTLQTLEKETAEARTARRLIQILLENPKSLWSILKRRGVYLHSKQFRQIENFIRESEQKAGEAFFERQKKYHQLGYVEAYHSLTSPKQQWTQTELLEAAEKSVCRNTGWPMGVVLHSDAKRPSFKRDGIEAILEEEAGYDEWFLKKNGDFRCFRIFEEDWKTRPQKNDILYFDLRILRIIEIILHAENLYRALKVNPNESIELEIIHAGLEGRKLSSSNPLKAFTFNGGKCHEKRPVTWKIQTCLRDLKNNRFTYVTQSVQELFVLFGGWKPVCGVVEGLYESFMQSRA